MNKKTKNTILSIIIGIILLIEVISIIVFGITLMIDMSKTQKEIDRQIGVDYSKYEVLETKYVAYGYVKYVNVKINDDWFLYKICKDNENIVVELVK